MRAFKAGDDVYVNSSGNGRITKIRMDSNGRAIYDVHLTSYNTVENGMIVARAEELQEVQYLSALKD